MLQQEFAKSKKTTEDESTRIKQEHGRVLLYLGTTGKQKIAEDSDESQLCGTWVEAWKPR